MTTAGTPAEPFPSGLGAQYRIDRELGRGGMGTVYLGYDRMLQRQVAIKIVRPELTTPRHQRRLTREARILASFTHPNIVPIHQAGEADGVVYFVMAYMAGDTLKARLERGPLSLEEVVRLGADLLSGLEAAHNRGIVHRDLKPANIFLQDGRAVIGDFGLALSSGEESDLSTTTHGQKGTPGYRSPEQVGGEPVTARSDLYVVGVILYEACTGRNWSPESADWSGIPGRLMRVLRRALAWEAETRWSDAASFRRALQRTPRMGRKLLLAAPAVLVLVLFGVEWSRREQAGPPPAQPPVELTILPFSRGESNDAESRALARYAGLALEWFPRVRLRPMTFSLALRPPGSLEEVRKLRTTYYVEGEPRPVSAGTIVSLSVRDSTGTLFETLDVPGNPNDPPGWGRNIADSLVRRIFPERYRSFRDLVARGGSVDRQAIDEFIAGEDAFHADAYRQAEAHYRRSTELDPGFAVAGWHLALVRRWLRILSEAELRRLATQHGDNLPEHYRALLEAQLQPDLERRFAEYRAVIARFPNNGYAQLLYADELFHRGPLAGIPLDSAIPALERAVRLDPYLDQAPAYDHTTLAYIRLGRRDEAKRELMARERIAAARRAAGFDEGSQRTDFLKLAYYERFSPRLGGLIRTYSLWRPDSHTIAGIATYVRLGLSIDIPRSQLALGRILVREGAHDSLKAQGYEAQGLALVALGRPRAAMAYFDSAGRLFNSVESRLERTQWRLLPAVLGLPAMDSAETAWARSGLAGLVEDSTVATRATWTLAMDAFARGDLGELGRLGALIRRHPPTPRRERLLRFTEALEQAGAGHLDSAVALSRPLLAFDPTVRAGDPFARAALFLLRAEWLTALGRLEEADHMLLWQENSDIDGWAHREAQAGDVDGALGVYARLKRAKLALQRGRAAEGCAVFRRVLELWSDSEPAMASLVAEAAARARDCPQ